MVIGLFIILISGLYFTHYYNRHLNPPWDGYRIHDFGIYYHAAKKMNNGGNPYIYEKFRHPLPMLPVFSTCLSLGLLRKIFETLLFGGRSQTIFSWW